MMIKRRWKPSQVALQTATVDDLKFILGEAKDKVRETGADAQKLYERSILLVSISLTALTSAIGYVALNFKFTYITVTLSAIIVLLWVICAVLKRNITPQPYLADGTDPESIMTDGMFTNLVGRTPEWYLTAHLIDKYNDRIYFNDGNNIVRSKNIRIAVRILYAIPVVCIVILAIFLFLNKGFGICAFVI